MVAELARRYSKGEDPATVTLRGLSDVERSALADLLGSARLPSRAQRLTVARLCQALDVPDGSALRAMVTELTGPLPDRRQELLATTTARDDLWQWLAQSMADLSWPGQSGALDWGPWVDELRRRGLRGGLEVHRRRLEAVLSILVPLADPGAAGRSLAGLAGEVLGDPHALDRGRSVAAIVLLAVAHAAGTPPPDDAETVRLTWESAGVAPDPLSSTVLMLGVRGGARDGLAGYLDLAAERSEPVVLTLSQLRRWPLAGAPEVFVVENPSLVAHAATTGWRGPPLVCSSGRPTVAVVTALRQLAVGGGVLHQHADFDATGIGITAWLRDRAGTVPWRMGAADYQTVVPAHGQRVPLRAAVPPTPWDERLHEVMTTAGVAVYEEEVCAALLREMLETMGDGTG